MLQKDHYWMPNWRFAIPALVVLFLSEGGDAILSV